MSSKESKTQASVSLSALPDYFRDVASQLEQRVKDAHGDALPLADFVKMRIQVKREGERAEIKMKVKWPSSKSEGEEGDTPPGEKTEKVKYKTLKKRMEETFEAIKKDLKKGAMPAAGTVASYLDAAAAMIRYPGKGDPFYGDFEKACVAFRRACKNDDVIGARVAYEEMRALKDACHDRYK